MVEMKERRDLSRKGTLTWTAAEAEYQSALIAYDLVVRSV
jgi:hypothetical protein